MKNNTLIAALLLLATLFLSATGYAYSEKIVASLDDKSVTVEILTTYVDEVAGSNYQPWLGDKDGLRRLADFYINRTLLLEYAKQTVAKDDSIVGNHNARSVDTDVMYLTSLLKTEVQDKVQVSEEAVAAYMTAKQISSGKHARQELESEQKNQLMEHLIEKVRTGHRIIYY